ncbi:YggS family pyridoxal phosphate-dependent enzyme [soil metagenome]
MTDSPVYSTEVARRLAEVHDRIRAAGGHDVQVMAVTKGFGPDAIDAAVAAGCRAIGENYAQELLAKRDTLDRHRGSLEVHFIGRLQSNKVRALAGVVHRYSTVDRESLVREIARRDPGARILVQVDTTATPDKGGCAPDDAAELVQQAREAGLAVEGLMTVGPTDGGPDAAVPGFRVVRALADDLDLEVCSMGMSADLEAAVAAGSTEVRLGTALFGERPPRR